MRLLRACSGSTLWLLGGEQYAILNLRREAAARGIAPDRIVFAPKVPNDEHIARQRLADLFLDTLPCNAHATASDALWAGLPVLTCLGNTFAGRVGASLLRAVGLPEMVTESLPQYEALAISLARDPERLAAIKARTRAKSPQRTVVRYRGIYPRSGSRIRGHMAPAAGGFGARGRRCLMPSRAVLTPKRRSCGSPGLPRGGVRRRRCIPRPTDRL